MQQDLIEKHYGSVFNNEQSLLRAVLKIHNNGNTIDLDPMFNKGMFYKKGFVDFPKLKYDLSPIEGVKKGNATNLPLDACSVKSMILDPPFLFGIHGKTEDNVCSKRYTIIENFDEMVKLYKGILSESYRILEDNGLLIFKCQDYTDSKTTMTHSLVYNWAIELDFYAKDIAILVKNNKIFNPNVIQRHLRKVHSYFWVFQKKVHKSGEKKR